MDRPAFLDALVRRCGKQPDYLNQIEAQDGPLIGLVGFDNYPNPGQFTYFTHGLHLLNKPEWKAGRPEYFITIDRNDRAFALFFAYLISAFAFEKVMGWNTLIGAGETDAVENYPYRRIALGPPNIWNGRVTKSKNPEPARSILAWRTLSAMTTLFRPLKPVLATCNRR